MNRTLLLLLAVLSLWLPTLQDGFAQVLPKVCFNPTGTTTGDASAIVDPISGCSLIRIGVPSPVGASMLGDSGATLSGVLTGDLGYINPAVDSAVLSSGCVANGGPVLFFATTYTPGVHVVTATFTDCNYGTVFSGKLTILALPPPTSFPPPPGSCGPAVLIDPVNSVPQLWVGNQPDSSPYDLAIATGSVQGVAADGVAQLFLRIPAPIAATKSLSI
jgi:hypothetical protein